MCMLQVEKPLSIEKKCVQLTVPEKERKKPTELLRSIKRTSELKSGEKKIVKFQKPVNNHTTDLKVEKTNEESMNSKSKESEVSEKQSGDKETVVLKNEPKPTELQNGEASSSNNEKCT